MRYILLVILPLLALFMQTTIFHTFSIKGVIPDMVLILVIFYALFNGSTKAAVYGVLFGLLEDLYTGRMIGVNALSKGAIAYLLGRSHGVVFKENILVGILGVIVGTLLNSSLLFFLSIISFGIFNLDKNIFMDLIYQVIYNTLISIPMYIWYYRSSNRGLLQEIGDY